MQTKQIRWTPDAHWSDSADGFRDADLVLVFADAAYFQTPACYHDLKDKFPRAHIVGCSSSGSVLGNIVSDSDVVATAIRFEHGKARLAVADITAGEGIRSLADGLMGKLKSDDLKHVLVLSDGLLVNGSDLAAGLNRYRA